MKRSDLPRKIKDLPPNKSLDGIRFYHPETREVCYWRSQWQKSVWYKKKPEDTEIFPLFIKDLKEALEFDLVK